MCIFLCLIQVNVKMHITLMNMLLFLIDVSIISKGPVSQHFYWLFGWKLKNHSKNQKYQVKYVKKRGQVTTPIRKQTNDEKHFLFPWP